MRLKLGGIGSQFYGEGDLRPDGSYITTDWFVVAYIPLFPLGSRRVVCEGRKRSYFVSKLQPEEMVERMSLCWLQVLRVYAFVAILYVWAVFDAWLFFKKLNIADRPHVTINGLIFGLTLFVPFMVLWEIRRRRYRDRVSFASSSSPRGQ
jgi:hypothetical protein